MITIQFTRYEDNATVIIPMDNADYFSFDPTQAAILLNQDADFIHEVMQTEFAEGYTFAIFDDNKEQIGEGQILIDGEIPSHDELHKELNK